MISSYLTAVQRSSKDTLGRGGRGDYFVVAGVVVTFVVGKPTADRTRRSKALVVERRVASVVGGVPTWLAWRYGPPRDQI